MRILEYDEVDPVGVLHLNLMSLGYALTPERVARIRKLDARPFPFFAIYAVEDGVVAGQVGIYRLPMISIYGREEVGGIWAVCVHPAFRRRGFARLLHEEAHRRMQHAGLRYSTLGTARHRGAYELYRQMGYEDVFSYTSAIIRHEPNESPTGLAARQAQEQELGWMEELFARLAADRLGFAWRHAGFLQALIEADDLDIREIWWIERNGERVGYVLARQAENVLHVWDSLLDVHVTIDDALGLLAKSCGTTYVEATIYRARDIERLRQAGYQLATPNWSVFMMKTLSPEANLNEARVRFGFRTERFLISPIDVT